MYESLVGLIIQKINTVTILKILETTEKYVVAKILQSELDISGIDIRITYEDLEKKYVVLKQNEENKGEK